MAADGHVSEGAVACRGVRGATIAAANTREAILDATREMLEQIVAVNGIDTADIASAIFSLTPDLDAVHPAVAARELGWVMVPLFCVQEVAVPGALERAIRVLIHWNTRRPQAEIQHVYLRGAEALRPDLAIIQQRGDQS